MRRIRPLLVAGTLVLAVGIGTTVALTTRQAPTATAAAPISVVVRSEAIPCPMSCWLLSRVIPASEAAGLPPPSTRMMSVREEADPAAASVLNGEASVPVPLLAELGCTYQ